MTGIKKIAAALATASLLISGVTQAALIDRGGGLIYDTVLNITWLQDSNYIQTSGFDADGQLSWNAANAWAAGLNYFDSVRNVTYTDWRLPRVNPVGASFDYSFSNNGTTDVGYGNTSPNSELAYMYYVNLGNLGGCTPNNASPGSCAFQSGFGLANTAPFNGLYSSGYWMETVFAPSPSGTWAFFIADGEQAHLNNSNELQSAWAVRSGDVAGAQQGVPEPTSLVLLGLGLASLAAATQRRRTLGVS